MKKDRTSTVIAVTIVVGLILLIGGIRSSASKCRYIDCDRKATDGSRYCYSHYLLVRSSGTPDYSSSSGSTQSSSRSTTSPSSSSYSSSTTSKSTSSSTSSGTTSSWKNSKKSSSSSSKKNGNPYEAYDKGYEDVTEDEDYDWDRYNSDPDYADGVDDAMEENEEDW
nr:hypothetical protein [Eubacterium sp.]